MKIFDTHAHYDDRAFDEDREYLLNGGLQEEITDLVTAEETEKNDMLSVDKKGEESRIYRVENITNIGCSMKSSRVSVDFASRFPYIYAVIGVIPHHVDEMSEEDIEDIAMLKEVAKKLNKDPEPINKIIWEMYYKKPTIDLLGRLTPTGTTHTGIYKITSLKTGQCYIGQSVDLRNRLRDHIKAGLGIASSNNRFYTEMKTNGPEAFMYEVLEECDRTALNEKERF